MWTLKHEISSPKFHELFIKIELKGETALDLNSFYNHITMCLNAVTRLQEDLISAYHSIKIHFYKYFCHTLNGPARRLTESEGK